MMLIENGATDVSVPFIVYDASTGLPMTSLTIANLDIYYHKEGAAMAAKVDATALDAADSAHLDNKAFEIGLGEIRVDYPDAAFNGGSGTYVTLHCAYTGAIIPPIRVDLTPSIGVTSTVNDASATATSFGTNLTNTTPDFYRDTCLQFTTGALKGQSSWVSASADVDGTVVVTVSEAYSAAPANGVEFVLLGRRE